MRRQARQAGFTLLEVIVVVALIAILATIAVPSLFGDARRTRGGAEVATMFSDLRIRMDQFQMENGAYPTSLGESARWPLNPGPEPQPLLPLPTAWAALNVRISGATDVYCGYTWVTGLGGDGSAIETEGAAFGFSAPPTNWYYLLAKCDLDGDSAKDSFYFTSSVDPTILKRNEGT